MLSTVWNPQRFTEFHREEKREERDKVNQEERRGIKRRETNLASYQFPKCSPQPGTLKEIQSWVEKRSGREEIEVTLRRKRRVKRGRGQSSQ